MLQIVGVHGAALIHALFAKEGIITIEFKTAYGYESILFPIVTDIRRGVHVLLDIRSYHGFGPKPPAPKKAAGVAKPKHTKVKGIVDQVG